MYNLSIYQSICQDTYLSISIIYGYRVQFLFLFICFEGPQWKQGLACLY